MKGEGDKTTNNLVDKMVEVLGEAENTPRSADWSKFLAHETAKVKSANRRKSLRQVTLLIGLLAVLIGAIGALVDEKADSPRSMNTTDNTKEIKETPRLTSGNKEPQEPSQTKSLEPERTAEDKPSVDLSTNTKLVKEDIAPDNKVDKSESLSIQQLPVSDAQAIRVKDKIKDISVTKLGESGNRALSEIALIEEVNYNFSSLERLKGLTTSFSADSANYLNTEFKYGFVKEKNLKIVVSVPISFARKGPVPWESVTFKNWSVGLEWEKRLTRSVELIYGIRLLHQDQTYTLNRFLLGDISIDHTNLKFEAFSLPIQLKYWINQSHESWYVAAGFGTYNILRKKESSQYRWSFPAANRIGQTIKESKGLSFSNTNLFSTLDIAIGRRIPIREGSIFEVEIFGALPTIPRSSGDNIALSDLVTFGFNLKYILPRKENE